MPIEEMPIELIILRMCHFTETSPVHNCLRTSIRSNIKQFQTFEFAVAIQSVFEASESKALNIRKILIVFCNEVAMVATNKGCFGWIGHMFVTGLTKSP